MRHPDRLVKEVLSADGAEKVTPEQNRGGSEAVCSELGGGRCWVAVFMLHSLGLCELCAIEKEWTGRKGGREKIIHSAVQVPWRRCGNTKS